MIKLKDNGDYERLCPCMLEQSFLLKCETVMMIGFFILHFCKGCLSHLRSLGMSDVMRGNLLSDI